MHNSNRPSSFLVGPALARLSAKIAPLVQNELAGTLIAELERHFNEQLLSELQQQVDAIIDRELPKRVEVMADLSGPSSSGSAPTGRLPAGLAPMKLLHASR